MRKTLILLASLFTLGTYAQVSEFKPGIAADGVNYILPKTAVKADVSAVKITYTPGEFAKYAERYLHISNVKTEADTKWQISGITISSYGVPDKSKCYTVKLKDKTLAPLIQLTDDGMLVSVNDNVALPEQPALTGKKTNNKLDSRKYLTSDILAAASTAKMAELTAQEILDIRESKNTICRGQAESMPKDGASLKVVLAELDAQERALMQMFVGYVDTVSCHEVYSVVPEQEMEREVFFRFSRKLGFVDADDLAGEPYYISIKDQHTVDIPTPEELAKRKINGLVYNMPGKCYVTIGTASSTVYDHELPFAQFGTTDILGNALFTSKEFNTKVRFSTVTGAIMHIEK